MLETVGSNTVADMEGKCLPMDSSPSFVDLGVLGHWEPGPASRRRPALQLKASPPGRWHARCVGESIMLIHSDRMLAGDWEKSADPDGDKDDDFDDGDDDDDDDVFPDDEEGDDGDDFDDDDDDDDDECGQDSSRKPLRQETEIGPLC